MCRLSICIYRGMPKGKTDKRYRKAIDHSLAGEKINSQFIPLEPLKPHGIKKRVGVLWLCKCNCGNEFIARQAFIKSGKRKSCGCLKNAEGEQSSHWKGYGNISKNYFSTCQIGAARRDVKFELSIKFLDNLFEAQNKKCALSGLKLAFDTVRSRQTTASLDRIDSSEGYVVGNVQWVHKDINQMKMDMPEKRFFEYIELIYLNKKRNPQ